jgi:hypothetical protein
MFRIQQEAVGHVFAQPHPNIHKHGIIHHGSGVILSTARHRPFVGCLRKVASGRIKEQYEIVAAKRNQTV